MNMRICAFNVQSLGVTKVGDKPIVAEIVTIMNTYDIILIQEIRDSSTVVAQKLLDELNKVAHPDTFSYVQSQQLGKQKKGSYKERYAYFYREKRVKRIRTEQWPLNFAVFARAPFSIIVQDPDDTDSKFMFVGIHVAPDKAVKEINALTNVYDTYKEEFKIPIIIGGDFNAAPDYVNPKEYDPVKTDDWSKIKLRTEARFNWLILDTWNTTTSTLQQKAYDRFVTTSAKFDSAGVHDMDDADVSDHRPIYCRYRE